MILKFVCAHASYTHPCHFLSADVRAIRRKLLASTTNILANTKSSLGQAYNKLEINVNSSSLPSRARSTWWCTEYNVVINLPNRSIFLYCVVKSQNLKKPKFWLESNQQIVQTLQKIFIFVYYFIKYKYNLFLRSQLKKITYFLYV